MAFLQARASGEAQPVAEVPVDEVVAAPVEVQAVAEVADEGELAESDLPEIAIDQEILEVFLLEMQELLAEWVRTAGQLRAMPNDGMLIANLRRVAHTVKGAARMVGFHDLGTIGWRVEEVLDLLDERDLAAAPAVMDFVDRSYALIERLSADTNVAPSTYAAESAELDRLHEELAAAIKAGELATAAEAAPRSEAQGEDRLVAAGATGDAGGDEGQEYGDEEIDDELLGVFVQEADDHLAAFNRALVALDRNPADNSQKLEAKRVVHTLKGASAALGYPVTAALCHSIEDLFEQLDSTGRQPSREMMTLFFESAETLEALMAGITAGRGENAAQAAPLRARYAAFLKGEPVAQQDTVVQQAPVAGAEGAPQRGGEATARSVRVDIAHLDNLLNLVGELVINRTSQEQHLERLGRTVNELLLSVDRLRRVGFQLESRYEVAELLRGDQRHTTGDSRPASAGTPAGGSRLRLLSPQGGEEEEFDSLEMDRYTELHRISRELVEIAADINTAGTELDGLYDNFDQTLSRQSRIATDLQDRMMEVRLVPISTLAARLYRAVRGVAQRRSRAVELVIEGETVEIDKVLLEEITDPLLHLVRNAADHGIESPQDRRAKGKAAGGTIRLTAAREGNEAVIRVSDDGAGIDLDRVLEKAVARGVVRNRDGMTREQILDLIFLPGFSTSASVSDISGRGVGLDVVRTNVRRLKGTIDVESTPGLGTTFTIRLPIMLAVTRALLIRSGAQTFAIPLPVVEQVAFFRKEQVSTVGGGDLFDLGGETYPVVYLSRALGLTDTSETLSAGARALIVGNIDRRIALVVDELVGQQEIVVKQLGRHLQSVAGVAGATILGNGQVVLILNVLDLIGDRRAVRPASGRSSVDVAVAQPQPLRPIGAARGPEGPRVAMIVDDSLSVRRVLTRTLERDGWQVVGAKDGVEALEMLAWANPRVMVLDIEMPRMDGYELTSLIRNHPDYHDLPIAMLTSRAGEKHRRKAFDLGVTAYLVKPFEETDLLRTVRELSMTARQARDAG
ncbi:MAG: Hpt domain-containing protein [Thermomicrobiales bacterium]